MKASGAKRFSWRAELLPLLLILAVYALAYLPRIDQFGFYKDDWHMIYHGYTWGANTIADSFVSDRPLMGQVNRIVYLLLGPAPLAWNLFAFAVHFLSVLALYLLARLIWPAHRLPALLSGLLFAVYPGFLQQPNAATFQNHFIGLTIALSSIVCTAAALRSRGPRRVALLAASALSVVAYLFIYEYMIGLEVLRLVCLLLILRGRSRRPTGAALLAALPAWLGAGAFLIWRMFIFHSTRPATDEARVFSEFIAHPSLVLPTLGMQGFKDFLQVIWMAWSVPLYTVWGNGDRTGFLAALALAALGFGMTVICLHSISGNNFSSEDGWASGALAGGFTAVIGALVPVLLAGRSIHFAAQFDRYTLHAAPGAALAAAGLVTLVFQPRLRAWCIASLCALGILTHALNAIYWAGFWKAQVSLWQQVSWRVPALADGALLMPRLPAGYGLAEDYEIFSPANLIYHPAQKALRIYGEVLNEDTAKLIVSRDTDSYRFIRGFELLRDFSNVLLVDATDPNACAHFIDGQQPELNASRSALWFHTASYSRIDLIDPQGALPSPPLVIFGQPPAQERDWCWYYQSAALARQREDWTRVLDLLHQAQSRELGPADPTEWLPFLRAAVELGDEDTIGMLTQRIRASRDAWLGVCVLAPPTNGLMLRPEYQSLCAPLDAQ